MRMVRKLLAGLILPIAIFQFSGCAHEPEIMQNFGEGSTSFARRWLPPDILNEKTTHTKLLVNAGNFMVVKVTGEKGSKILVVDISKPEHPFIEFKKKHLEKALYYAYGGQLVPAVALPMRLASQDAKFRLLVQKHGCRLVKAIVWMEPDKVILIKGKYRVVKEWSISHLEESLEYFRVFTLNVDYKANVIVPKLPLRKEPTEQSEALTELHQGQVVNVLDEWGPWRQVETKNQWVGWVHYTEVSGGNLKLTPGRVAVKRIEFNLYRDNKLIPVFSHLYGRTGYKGIKEIGQEPSVAKSLMRMGLQTKNKNLLRAALLISLIEGFSSMDKGSPSYAFSKLYLQNTGDTPTTAQIEVDVPQYCIPAIRTATLPPGEEICIEATPKFTENLCSLTEQKPWQVTVRVTDSHGKAIYADSREIEILSANDMIWTLNEPFDAAPLIATFVTPRDKHRIIDKILRACVDRCELKSMEGYMENPKMSHQEVVNAQFKAIFDTLSELGIKYVNAPISFTGSQRIKFPYEIIKDRSGNCIEVSVLYASILEALRMRPVIALVPNHAFVGVRVWEDPSAPIMWLEGTITGYDSYNKARNVGQAEYERWAKENRLLLIDIAKCRKLGITPMPGA